MKIERSGVVASGWAALALVATLSAAQPLELPRSSPRAQVTQAVGVSTVTIEFGLVAERPSP